MKPRKTLRLIVLGICIASYYADVLSSTVVPRKPKNESASTLNYAKEEFDTETKDLILGWRKHTVGIAGRVGKARSKKLNNGKAHKNVFRGRKRKRTTAELQNDDLTTKIPKKLKRRTTTPYSDAEYPNFRVKGRRKQKGAGVLEVIAPQPPPARNPIFLNKLMPTPRDDRTYPTYNLWQSENNYWNSTSPDPHRWNPFVYSTTSYPYWADSFNNSWPSTPNFFTTYYPNYNWSNFYQSTAYQNWQWSTFYVHNTTMGDYYTSYNYSPTYFYPGASPDYTPQQYYHNISSPEYFYNNQNFTTYFPNYNWSFVYDNYSTYEPKYWSTFAENITESYVASYNWSTFAYYNSTDDESWNTTSYPKMSISTTLGIRMSRNSAFG